jgi:hypothetical protein
MAVRRLRAKRLGLRQSPAAFVTIAQAEAPEDWPTPRRFAPAAAYPISMLCGAACGRWPGRKTRFSHRSNTDCAGARHSCRINVRRPPVPPASSVCPGSPLRRHECRAPSHRPVSFSSFVAPRRGACFRPENVRGAVGRAVLCAPPAGCRVWPQRRATECAPYQRIVLALVLPPRAILILRLTLAAVVIACQQMKCGRPRLSSLPAGWWFYFYFARLACA